MEKSEIEKATVSLTEGVSPEKLPPNAYSGDHVTARPLSSAAERSLFLKSAILITTLAALIYFVAYLDRNSIGNARIAGMQEDLEMTEDQYSTAVSMFFVGYIIFMLPANILLRYIPPNFQLGGSVLIFGALVCGLGAAKNYNTVLALRILIGTAQAFIQGLTVYMSLWFKRNEVATIGATFYSAATISGAFSGFIAYGAVKNLSEDATGRSAWSWIYIIDGAVALFVGVLTAFLLPRFPDKIVNGKHWLFTSEEIKIACERAASFNTMGAKIEYSQLWAALKDPKAWAFVVMQAGIAQGVGTVGVFLPSFIREFGYSRLHTQLFSVIPYACAFVTLIGVCYVSDRFNKKGVFLASTIGISIIGYVILITDASTPVKVFATCLVTSGLYPSVVLLTSWLGINTAGFAKRGMTWAMAEVSGQSFSIMGTHLYNDPPRYIQGHSINLAFLSAAFLSAVALIFWLRHENNRKDRIDAEYRERGEQHPHALRTLEEELDKHQFFRYIL